MDEEEKKDLLRILSHAYDQKDLDGLVFLDIQKIFYYVQERLDDSNNITDLLQYYWYIDGCMSDTVEEAVGYGVNNNILSATPTQHTQAGTWYQFDAEAPPLSESDSEDLEQALEAVEVVLSEDYNVFNEYEPKIRGLYKDAPLSFQRYFKTELLWYVESFKDGDLRSRDAKEISYRVGMGESHLPLDPRYASFNDLYSKYMNVSQKYLDQSDGEHSGLFVIFSSLTDDIWGLFCKQLRLCEHDSYYDTEIDKWQQDYADKEEQVMDLVLSFDKLINSEFPDNNESSDRAPESSGWGAVAEAYLSDAGAQSD